MSWYFWQTCQQKSRAFRVMIFNALMASYNQRLNEFINSFRGKAIIWIIFKKVPKFVLDWHRLRKPKSAWKKKTRQRIWTRGIQYMFSCLTFSPLSPNCFLCCRNKKKDSAMNQLKCNFRFRVPGKTNTNILTHGSWSAAHAKPPLVVHNPI